MRSVWDSLPSDKVFIAPSGVQKERIEPSHIFVLPFPQQTPSPHTDRIFLRRPTLNLKESACTPLFWNAFDLRDAGSCIHTHSQNAVMATLLWPGSVFRISHQVSFWVSNSPTLGYLLKKLWLGGTLLFNWQEVRPERCILIDDQRCSCWGHWSDIVLFGHAWAAYNREHA